MKMKKVISVVLACACVFSFAACGSKSDSSKSDSAKSDEKEKLVMATNAEFPPFEYYDGDEVVGIDAEFAAAIADKLGMDLKIEDMAFDSIIPAVQSGKAPLYFTYNLAIFNFYNSICTLCNFHIMCNHNNCLFIISVRFS